MRSIVLMVITLVALAAALVVFLQLQSTPTAVRQESNHTRVAPLPAPATEPGESVLGAGDGVWIQTYDKDSGELLNEFRADRYEPPRDGVVHVYRPQARFYTRDGQVLTLEATHGDVVMPESGRRQQRIDSIEAGPPSRGTLHNVTLGLLEDESAVEPSITCVVPILAFDNDTLKMNTVQTQIDGKDVLADRVPVTVRGQYEFDGQGLTIRWNQRDQRLEHLEITHGRRLLVKNPGTFGGFSAQAQADALGRPIPLQLADTDPATAARLAAEDRQRRAEKRAAQARRAAATRAAARVRTPVAYVAVFDEAVRVHEGSTEIATADRLTATFTFDKPAATQPATTRSSTAPSTRPATRRARAATSAPATQPQAPIELTWTGKLVITPVVLTDSGLTSAGDRLIGLEGKPARLVRQGSSIVAASILASTEGERFTARALPGERVTLTDPSGLSLVTDSLDFAGELATLTGPSSATLPVTDADGTKQTFKITWAERATLHLNETVSGRRSIDRATFASKVDIAHPQFSLSSDTLSLALDGASATPTLRGLEAAGSVIVVARGEDGARQRMTADKLMATAVTDDDGRLRIDTIDAGGNVHVDGDGNTLTAQRLEAKFAAAPAATTRPAGGFSQAAAIESLRAAGDVRFGDGSATATADVLTLAGEEAQQVITLQGKPATLGDPASGLTGDLIKVRFEPDKGPNHAIVVGPGRLVGMGQVAGPEPRRPLELAWSEAFEFIARENKIDVRGDVVVQSTGSDGSLQKATGRRMRIDLADTALATRPADAAPTTRPQALGDKRVVAITLSDEVELSNVLPGPAGGEQFLRRMYAYAPEVRVAIDPAGDPGAVTIPSGGRLLVDDRQPPAAGTNPATQKAQNVPGAIAVEWLKNMTYDPARRQATLDGGVTVVFQRTGEDALRLQSQQLIAELSPAGRDRPVERVRAEGGVVVSNRQVSLHALHAVYDPAANNIVARGTPQQMVEVSAEGGASNFRVEEVTWDLATNRPQRLKNVQGGVRR